MAQGGYLGTVLVTDDCGGHPDSVTGMGVSKLKLSGG